MTISLWENLDIFKSQKNCHSAILAPGVLLLLDAPTSMTQCVLGVIYVGLEDEHDCFLRAICFRLKGNVLVFTFFFCCH